MKRFVKITSALLALAAIIAFAVSCGPTGKAKYDTDLTGEGISVRMSMVSREIDKYKVDDFEESRQESDFVLIRVKDYGEIVIALRSDIAPITVKNFKSLVSSGFYDGTVFHRVMENFMIRAAGMSMPAVSL